MKIAAFACAKMALVPVLALALSGCSREKPYPVTVEAAQTALVGSKIPDIAFGFTAHSEAAVATSGGVEWRIRRGPSDAEDSGTSGSQASLLILTARLDPVSGGTKVTVGVEPATSAQAAAFAQGLEQKPAVAAMFRSIASEQVDATLSHRDFDFANIRQSMAVATLSMAPQIKSDMDKAGEEFRRRDRERVDEAYRAEARGDFAQREPRSAPTSTNPQR